MLLKDPRDQADENYLVVMVKDEGNSVLAGLREAYWRQWEGHYIPEFRVTIREMKDTSTTPKTPMTCVYQKILPLVLLSTTAHDMGVLSYSVRRPLFARASSSSARCAHRRLFCRDGSV